jgi:protein phosphatase 1B
MGAFLDKPKTEKYNESNVGGGLKYGLSSMQGWRIEMEDAHSAVIGIPDQKENVSWFAVFDGHAGSRVSAHCSHHLLDCIRASDDFTCSLQQEQTLSQDELMDGIKKGILKGFLELDEKLRRIPEVASGEDKSGTTAVCALITQKYLIIANCGDSRGVCCTDGKPVLATQDHKPSNEPEKERIQNAGGSVMIQRVNGSLAVSRALGDFEYKNVEGKGPTEQLVSPEPEFYIKTRDSALDQFLVLACDGVWDVMSNEDICNFITHRMKVQDNLEVICNEVIDTCLYKGSRDNMSIIIIAFPSAPKVDQEAVKKENELNAHLERKVTELIESHNNDVELSYVHQFLADEDIPHLPPGGGLASKKVLIEEIYKKLLPDRYEATQEECPNPLASLLFTNAKNAAEAE